MKKWTRPRGSQNRGTPSRPARCSLAANSPSYLFDQGQSHHLRARLLPLRSAHATDPQIPLEGVREGPLVSLLGCDDPHFHIVLLVSATNIERGIRLPRSEFLCEEASTERAPAVEYAVDYHVTTSCRKARFNTSATLILYLIRRIKLVNPQHVADRFTVQLQTIVLSPWPKLVVVQTSGFGGLGIEAHRSTRAS